jgi:hypothetical protein
MRYAMTNGREVVRAPDTPGVQGYLYNHGGLNNQKMALIGLILSGIKDKQTINLPYIYNRDQKTDQEYVVRIEEIFDLDRILHFAAQHDLQVLTQCPSGERGGWSYFRKFQQFISDVSNLDSLQTILNAVASMKPHIVSNPALLQMGEFVRGSLGIGTVVQLRIEEDWALHAQELRQQNGDSEDHALGFMQILAKVRKTFPDLNLIYATSDEKSMPASKNEIRALCRGAFGIGLLWKSDLLPTSLIDQLTSLDLSVIDFEIAKGSPRFVGLTSSTFSNMLCFEKLVATKKPVRGHYIYNCPGDVVVERKDNGLASYAQGAVVATRVDSFFA